MIWIHGTVGRGPEECHAALDGILIKTIEDATSKGLLATLLDYMPTKHGVSSFLIAIEGDGEEAFAATWNGTMQWIAKSTIRPQHKRKRWFVKLSVMSPVGSVDEKVAESDLTWESMKASGPGGQHVNKTESAVRLIHKPSGLVITAQEERSQQRNKSLALAKLRAKLADAKEMAAAGVAKEQWQNHDSLERGNAVRTFKGDKFTE